MKWIKELSEAIVDHLKIDITYKGAIREVAPHILGKGSEDQLLLSTFQFTHSTDASKNNQWRSFSVEKIESLRVLPSKFHTHSDYNPEDRTFQQVINQV